MNSEHFRKLYEEYASGVAYVAVEDAAGAQSIGTAFHVGEGVFVTARHVVDGKAILSVATTERSIQTVKVLEGARQIETTRWPGKGKMVRGPFLHPDENIDVAALVVEGINAPVIQLGGHLDDWLGTELVLRPVLVLGYPPIPFSKEPILVAATGEVNAIVDKYTGGHPHFVLSTMARGGFSGGLALTDFGCALGVITESLGLADQPPELGYLSVLTVEPIYVCLGTPQDHAARDERSVADWR
jgi:S1-C subfamily serine protease